MDKRSIYTCLHASSQQGRIRIRSASLKEGSRAACSRAAASQAPARGAAKQLRRARPLEPDPAPMGPDPEPLGPPQLWCLAGCGRATCGPAAFLRQGTVDAALLAAGMQACVSRELGVWVAHQAVQCVK